jgi:uncharacterized protein (TIGR00369 family)
VQLWHKGERPVSPNCSLLGLRFIDVAEGSVSLAMPASLWFCTGFGTFYGGALVALADTAINSAVTTTLPPRTSFGTLDLKVNFLRPVMPDGRDLVARATVEQRGRTIAVTTCRLDDADGKRVAMASGSAMISPDRPWPAPGLGHGDRSQVLTIQPGIRPGLACIFPSTVGYGNSGPSSRGGCHAVTRRAHDE